jgi:hypothetical protein
MTNLQIRRRGEELQVVRREETIAYMRNNQEYITKNKTRTEVNG